ncbi:MAG: hypothetical protein ACKVOR_11405 [Flavobacteriales bacterium]
MGHHFFWAITKAVVFISVIILAVALFKMWLRHRERHWAFILRQDNNRALAPLKISAYERIVVMLERMSPQSLVLRHQNYSASASFLQLELVKALREEFEHNVSLQMYVSAECWDKVKQAKEEINELIKVAFTKVRPESSAVDLTIEIMKLDTVTGNSAVKDALLAIRMEMARYF